MEMEETPKRFWEDDEWAEEHYDELVRKYPQKWVAVVHKKVVSVGDSPTKVREEARKKTGAEHIPITFVERGIVVY